MGTIQGILPGRMLARATGASRRYAFRTMDHTQQTRANEDAAFAAERTGDGTVPAWPMKFTVEFTADCNLHCFMCSCEMARDSWREQGVVKFAMPVETFRRIAEHAFPRTSVVNPTVVGEPFVLGYFDELVEACETYDVKLDLITNGMLLRGDRLRRLLPRIACVTISFDGATKPTFDYVRTGADFDKVMANLREFVDLRREMGLEKACKLTFNVTLLHENVHELPQIVEIAAEHDVDLVGAGYMYVFDESLKTSSPHRDPARTNAFVDQARQRARELGVHAVLPGPIPENARVTLAPEDLDMRPTAGDADAPSAPPIPPAPAPEPPPPTSDRGAAAPLAAATPSGGTVPMSPTIDKLTSLFAAIPEDYQGKAWCKFPWREVFIGQGGDVTPCCVPGRPVFGNAFEGDFEQIWNGPGYRALREGMRDGTPPDYCTGCSFLQRKS